MSEALFKNLKENLIDKIVTDQVAFQALTFIRGRVYKAQYLEDSAGNTQYSTSPMPIPYGLAIKVLGKNFAKKKGKKKAIAAGSEFKVFRSKSGIMMVLIPGGYKQWREMNNKATDQVVMTWSARMMKNLGYTTPAVNKASLGFSSSEESKKAYYAHVGAGKKKVTHKFMDITEEELDSLGDLATRLIFEKL